MPEVAALASDLDRRLTGHAIDRLQVLQFAALKTFYPPVEAVRGLTITGVSRVGKYLVIVAGDLHVVVHLARAGWLRWFDALPANAGRPGKGPVAARLVLDDGTGITFTEAGTKKGLAIWVVRDPADVPGVATLGPDPLDPSFTVQRFAAVLAAAGRAQIKGVLRSQSIIAGIGNAYSDEILHAAKMSPFKPANMPEADVERLYAAMQTTLRDALARDDGVPPSELKGEKKSNMQVHGRTGEICPVCGDVVRQVRFADNSLQYCATCQTDGKPLADRAMSRLLK